MARTRITEIDGDETTEEKEEAPFPEHPLFPLEDGDKTFEVSFIQITRVESGVQKFGPSVPSNELNTEDDIFNRWGGGHYVLIARAATRGTGYPGRFKKHRRVNIPGTPKPLSPDPTPEEQKLASPQTASSAQGSPMGGSDPMSFFAMMMQMQQQSLERERQASEKAVAQNQQFMQMFMTVMQGSKADSQSMIQMMMQMSAQSQQSMLQFITAMMSNRGGGPEEMAKYAELMRALGMGGGEKKASNGEGASSESIGAMLENAADLVQGMVALKGAASPAPVGAPDPNGAAPMGGAASLLKGMLR